MSDQKPCRVTSLVKDSGPRIETTSFPQIPSPTPVSWENPVRFCPEAYYVVLIRMAGFWRPYLRQPNTADLHTTLCAAEARLAIAARELGADRVRIAKIVPTLGGLLPLYGLPSEADLDRIAEEAKAKANSAPENNSREPQAASHEPITKQGAQP